MLKKRKSLLAAGLFFISLILVVGALYAATFSIEIIGATSASPGETHSYYAKTIGGSDLTEYYWTMSVNNGSWTFIGSTQTVQVVAPDYDYAINCEARDLTGIAEDEVYVTVE